MRGRRTWTKIRQPVRLYRTCLRGPEEAPPRLFGSQRYPATRPSLQRFRVCVWRSAQARVIAKATNKPVITAMMTTVSVGMTLLRQIVRREDNLPMVFGDRFDRDQAIHQSLAQVVTHVRDAAFVTLSPQR